MPQAKPLVPYDVYYWKHFFRIAHAVIDIESSLLIKKILIIGIATFSRKVFYDPVRLLFFSAMTIKVWTITQSQKVTPIPRGSKKRQKRFRRESVLGR